MDSRSEEITDSVTDELEKLQQEGDTNNIGEVDGVNALLGDLDDDDELLGKFLVNKMDYNYANKFFNNVHIMYIYIYS